MPTAARRFGSFTQRSLRPDFMSGMPLLIGVPPGEKSVGMLATRWSCMLGAALQFIFHAENSVRVVSSRVSPERSKAQALRCPKGTRSEASGWRGGPAKTGLPAQASTSNVTQSSRRRRYVPPNAEINLPSLHILVFIDSLGERGCLGQCRSPLPSARAHLDCVDIVFTCCTPEDQARLFPLYQVPRIRQVAPKSSCSGPSLLRLQQLRKVDQSDVLFHQHESRKFACWKGIALLSSCRSPVCA